MSTAKHALWIILAASLLAPSAAVAQIVIATETAAGEYEGGTFTAVDPQFRLRFEIDEPAGQATLTEIVRLKSGTLIENTVAYQITAAEDGASASNLLEHSIRRCSAGPRTTGAFRSTSSRQMYSPQSSPKPERSFK